jgi:hypothetical protein
MRQLNNQDLIIDDQYQLIHNSYCIRWLRKNNLTELKSRQNSLHCVKVLIGTVWLAGLARHRSFRHPGMLNSGGQAFRLTNRANAHQQVYNLDDPVS